MADTNPFANLRRLASPTYWLELPEIPWRPVFALELEHDDGSNNELRNERFVQSIISRVDRTTIPDGLDTSKLRDLPPDTVRALLEVERGNFEADRRFYPSTIVRGWRNAQDINGAPVPFSPEACAQLFDPENGMPDKIFEKVRRAAKDANNFPGSATPTPAGVEAVSGNS